MNTYFSLMAEFETGEIPLADISEKYLGISLKKAEERARAQTLPFPVYRGGSQKSKWLVAAEELAKYLDAKKQKARDDWKRINAA
jgi:hypothetical protein